jgi:hypothetical protein
MTWIADNREQSETSAGEELGCRRAPPRVASALSTNRSLTIRISMPSEYQSRPIPTAAERLFKKVERQIEAVKASSEYRAEETAKIKNMLRLRELRLERERN